MRRTTVAGAITARWTGSTPHNPQNQVN